jgi:ribosome maturation factor RimP
MAARIPQRQQLMELLGPVITSQGYDLEDLSVTAAGRRSVIRVIVDSDTGIDLDGVAEVSRAISEVLDADADADAQPVTAAAFAGPYVLEVSSPGVDRPLTEPRHWRRAVGRLVSVAISDESVTGRVLAAGEDGIVLEVDGVKINHPLSELGPGRIQVEFSHADDQKEA